MYVRNTINTYTSYYLAPVHNMKVEIDGLVSPGDTDRGTRQC